MLLSEKLKELWEESGLLQRKVVAVIESTLLPTAKCRMGITFHAGNK